MSDEPINLRYEVDAINLRYGFYIVKGGDNRLPGFFEVGNNLFYKYYEINPTQELLIYGEDKTYKSSICKQVMYLTHREYINSSIKPIRDDTIRTLGHILMFYSDIKLSQYYLAVSYISLKGIRSDIIIPSELFLRELFDIAIFSLTDLNFIQEKKIIKGYINSSLLNTARKVLAKHGPYYQSNYHAINKYSMHLSRNFKGWIKLRLVYFRDILNNLFLQNISKIVINYLKTDVVKFYFDDFDSIVTII